MTRYKVDLVRVVYAHREVVVDASSALEAREKAVEMGRNVYEADYEVNTLALDASSLKPGDVVHWNDPDDGACSRDYKIRSVRVLEDGMVRIEDHDGDVLECHESELDLPS